MRLHQPELHGLVQPCCRCSELGYKHREIHLEVLSVPGYSTMKELFRDGFELNQASIMSGRDEEKVKAYPNRKAF